ncbi:MAG TPA: adenosylcobinamide-GDP ribazoletransferase [Nocardioidaceae bacterium]|nr:adenosylcobinamide-GDP ribazoletransferase [Nocardioidaceae bacterium]
MSADPSRPAPRRRTGADALRLAVGTLTVLPTRPPQVVDRRVASWAMTLAPLVGAALAVVAGGFLWLLGWAGYGLPQPGDLLPAALGGWQVSPLLAAALTIGLLALLTRAMHLDGLADTADGLGSGKPADKALEVMRRGDIGPFGVITLVLVLLVQVGALAEILVRGIGFTGVLLALVASRLALPLLCAQGVPPARQDGLGRVVAGTVSRSRLALSATGAIVLLAPFGLLSLGAAVFDVAAVARVVVVAGLALGAAALLARRATRRLGGITGDVLGAAVEITFTVALVVLALLT